MTKSGTTRIRLEERDGGKTVVVTMKGKLSKADYEVFVPEIERLIDEHGSIRMLVELIDFHGWSAGALWEDTKFAARHFTDIERLAIVGDSKWEKGMAVFCKPFTTADVRYFDISERGAAEAWLARNAE
ncbi:MAG: STAS/SEC14 domain-containing protein [Thermoanaerobaculia bacterium]|nr:STAS/SEC14 domain-containing protein [Thermoanaerobaculia bacterium]